MSNENNNSSDRNNQKGINGNQQLDDLLGLGDFTSSQPVAMPPQPVPAANNDLLIEDIFSFDVGPPKNPQTSTDSKLNGTLSAHSQKQALSSSSSSSSSDNSFTIYEKNNLKVKFSINRKEGGNTFIMMNAFNTSLIQITEFKFEASVPKTFQLAYASLINTTTINPNSSLNQLIQITNPKKVFFFSS